MKVNKGVAYNHNCLIRTPFRKLSTNLFFNRLELIDAEWNQALKAAQQSDRNANKQTKENNKSDAWRTKEWVTSSNNRPVYWPIKCYMIHIVPFGSLQFLFGFRTMATSETSPTHARWTYDRMLYIGRPAPDNISIFAFLFPAFGSFHFPASSPPS